MICKLPQELVNQISAGEVVERPASVVKELVENSIDASATSVEVHVKDGGHTSITIIDNGTGIKASQVALAFERHATSKIRVLDDLVNIKTLGFRGEALPSISSVSVIRIRTKVPDELEGTEICFRGGRVTEQRSCGAPSGTRVEVQDLFFNTPVRKKFLKSVATEFGHIQEVLVRQALANPSVAFLLTHQGKVVIEYPSTDLVGRVYQTMGDKRFSSLRPVEYEEDGLRVSGFASLPTSSLKIRGGSKVQFYTFLNKRFIRDKIINSAIIQAYGSLIDKSTMPYGIVYLELPTHQFDVNVHPSKIEVRFVDSHQVYELVMRTLRAMLANLHGELKASGVFEMRSEPIDRASRISDALSRYTAKNSSLSGRAFETRSSYPSYQREDFVPSPKPLPKDKGQELQGDIFTSPKVSETWFSGLRIVGQASGSFIICENEEGLVVIDQHAAHERINYERLRSQWKDKGIESQMLLIPETIDLPPNKVAVAQEHREHLVELGFEVEPFGSSSVVIKAIPAILEGIEVGSLIEEVLSELSQYGRSGSWEKFCEAMLMTMACHRSVVFSQRLSEPQTKVLLQELDSVDFSNYCPHGRPIFFSLPFTEIKNRFKR